MGRPKGSTNKPKAVNSKEKAASEGWGDAAIFVSILEEGQNYGQTLRIPTFKDIKQSGVNGNAYRGDFYEKANPGSKWQLFWWAPPVNNSDSKAYEERAMLDDKLYVEVVAHPEDGPFVTTNRWRKDAAFRVFNGRKQLFARPIDGFLEEREENTKIADREYDAQMDELDALADQYNLDVVENQDGGVKRLRVNNQKTRTRRRIYSR